MKTFLASLAALLPVVALAHDYSVNDLMVMHPVAKETTATARSSAGYFTITNNGDASDSLIGVEADFPRVMMHNTEVQDGVASMRHMDAVILEPGQTVTFEPGGFHVMFMGLSEPMTEGEEIPATLIFENAGRLDIVFNVEKIEAKDHSDHNH